MHFTKIHGLGNDFIAVDMRGRECPDFNALAPKWCDRHIGVGADGFAVVLPSDKADIRMRIIDADGTEAEMCGNGIRAFCKYVYDNGIVRKTDFTVETLGGIMHPVITKVENGKAKLVRVEMGKPEFAPEKVPVTGTEQVIERPVHVASGDFKYTAMAVGGVPHCAVFVDDLDAVDIARSGREIEHCGDFPALVNVNFAQRLDDRTVKVRTWERGCGCTLACGTGSTSVAVAGALTGRTGRSVDIELYLGTLHIDWEEDGRMYMEGPAEIVWEGDIPID